MATALSSFLGDNPQAVFQSRMARSTPQFGRFWGNRYNDIYGQYMGQQAQQAQMGQMPSGDFNSFLEQYPWLDKFYSYSPYQRGLSMNRMAPTTRFLNY